MTDFYIFRHGDTVETGNPFLRFIGHRDSDTRNIQMLPDAIPALEKIGKFLKANKTDADFCSPYVRCVESAKIVGGITGKKYENDARLRELEKNGEKTFEFEKRVRSFLDEINTKNYSAVSICTHGAVIGALKDLVSSNNFNFFDTWNFPSPGNLVIIKNKKVSQINFNS